MIRQPGLWRSLRHDDCGAQLVEFAVTLPLLVVFVVGIFDFSGAFTLKQKLTNVARDAARAAAAEPTTDLSAAVPVSVNDAFWMVDSYLQANRINDCGIDPTTVVQARPKWTYSAAGNGTNGCPTAGLTITINRGYYFPATAGRQPAGVNCVAQSAAGQTAVIATCVSIQYGYQWKFGQAASLLGRTQLLPNTITATAVAMNEN
ncbi:MAG TPA: TadE/TadG family type IV pilus assembly protein [Candidatus Sulfotelmatobacter sp.]|jgi:Flp pilus assembly protein TadG|nr:TadE/TadG family type IV pilus assembly protein [Candidatus Sulfotelmatobacter sp.]